MKNKTIKTNKVKVAFLLGMIALLLVNSFFTWSWLERITIVTNKTTISDFSIQGKIYFSSTNLSDNKMTINEILLLTPYQVPAGSMIKVNLTDKAATNYIGNLRIVLTYTGSSPAYIRIKILEQWSEDDEFIENLVTPYNIPATNDEIFAYGSAVKNIIPSYVNPPNNQGGTGWYDNRKGDFGFYYNAPIYPTDVANKAVNMLVINGISDANIKKMTNLRDGVELQLIVLAEAVQPNRYRELFGISKLPWEQN